MVEKSRNADYKSEIERLGTIIFVPNGVSMWPFLKNHGQSVVVERKTGRLEVYDVAFYQRENGSFVLHRVLKVLNDGYLTCGDSQLNLEKVKEEGVFGVMVEFYKGKTLINARDEKYLKRVKKWYERKKWRKFRLKIFYFSLRVKSKLKRIFTRKKQENV